MTPRPLTLRAPQVRAALDGRLSAIIVPLPQQPLWNDSPLTKGCWEYRAKSCDTVWWWTDEQLAEWLIQSGELPFGPGDVLWVRETWAVHEAGRRVNMRAEAWPSGFPVSRLRYPATDMAPFRRVLDGEAQSYWWNSRPPVTMPRWASRLTLIVGDVQVLRVQDVTGDQAVALGIENPEMQCYGPHCPTSCPEKGCFGQREEWQRLWATRYPKPPHDWPSNPWCALASVTVQHGNVDAMEAAE